jgi:hypothetical protein
MPGDGAILSGLRRLYGADAAAIILNGNVQDVANTVVSRLPNNRIRSAAAYYLSSILIRGPAIIDAVDGRRKWSAMLCGGSDSLHLRDRLERLLLSPSPREVRLSGGHNAVSSPHAHLLLPDAYGWHESLQRRGVVSPTVPTGAPGELMSPRQPWDIWANFEGHEKRAVGSQGSTHRTCWETDRIHLPAMTRGSRVIRTNTRWVRL